MRRTHRAARLAGAAALVALLAGPAVVGPVAHAAPATPAGTTTLPAASADAGTVVLTSVTPSVVTRATGVTVQGTLTAGSVALQAPTVSLVRGTSRLSTRDDVTSWATGTDPAAGTTYGAAQPAPTLAPGQQVGFTITVPVGRVRDATAWGALPVAVQVTSAQGTSAVHTFLGWWARKEYQPLQLGVVAPLTLAPSTRLWSDDPDTRARAWVDEIGPGSAVEHVLAGTDVPGVPVTWAVDPATVGDATGATGAGTSPTSTGTPSGTPTGSTPSGGSTPSAGSTGTPSPTTSDSSTGSSTDSSTGSSTGSRSPGGTAGAEAAAAAVRIERAQDALAARLVRGAGGHPLWALPPADPDLAAYAGTGDPTLTAQVRDSGALATRLQVPASSVTTGLAWPVDGALAPATEQALRTTYGSALQGALVSSSTLPSSSGYTPTSPHQSPGGLPVLAWDDDLSTLAARTTSAEQGVLATQQVVAQTAALLGQSPGIPRSFLLTLPRGFDPDPGALRGLLTALGTTPWVQVSDPATLLAAARTESPVSALSPSTWTTPGAAPGPGLLSRAAAARGSLDTVASLLPDRSGDRDRWADALDQLTSTRWRGRAAAAGSLVTGAQQWATASTSAIRVVPQDTNFLADEGTLQVTVVNDLTDPVSGLLVRLAPGNPRLRVVEQPAAVTIGAKSRITVAVQVRALAAGLVPVTVDLRTADGASVGTPAQLNVRANPPGRGFYLVSGGVVLLVLLAGLVRQARGGRRRRREVPSP